MALTAPQLLAPYLETLRASEAILVGIHSVPQLMHHLLPDDAPSQVLLLSQGPTGLRQTYFVDRQLRFSRLTPLASGSAENVATAAALEAGKMHQYLSTQRLIERKQPLATRVLVHPAYVEHLLRLENAFEARELRALFIRGEVIIAIESGDLFESGGMNPDADRDNAEKAARQFGALAGLALAINQNDRGRVLQEGPQAPAEL